MAVELIPVALPVMHPPQEDLFAKLNSSPLELRSGDILVITSKVVSIHQGRCVPSEPNVNKELLAQREADFFIPSASSKYGISLTITNSALIPSAGIDESNADGHLILLPEEPSGFAKLLWERMCRRFDIDRLGVVITDSHCTPLRWGVTGISIGTYGFNPLHDYRDKLDLFGRPFKFSQTNQADSIAAAAVGVMGEGDEGTPIVVVRGWPRLEFGTQHGFSCMTITPEEDVFAPLLKAFQKRRR